MLSVILKEKPRVGPEVHLNDVVVPEREDVVCGNLEGSVGVGGEDGGGVVEEDGSGLLEESDVVGGGVVVDVLAGYWAEDNSQKE